MKKSSSSKTTISNKLFMEWGAPYKNKNLTTSDSIIIIPGIGCTGCITNALNYFHNNVDTKHLTFIFNEIEDLRLFKQAIPTALWENNNVIIDSTNSLRKIGVETIYPIVLKQEKSGNLRISIFDTNNYEKNT